MSEYLDEETTADENYKIDDDFETSTTIDEPEEAEE